jgi:hypothetical protein
MLEISQTQFHIGISRVVIHTAIVAHAHGTTGIAPGSKFHMYLAYLFKLKHGIFIG